MVGSALAELRKVSTGRVVVFGGSGRVGRYVLRELGTDPRVDVVDADLVPVSEVEFVKADVLDIDAVRSATRGADAVCHLAGLDLDVDARPEDYIRVNTLGTWHVLQAAAECGVRKAVLMSSVAACGLSEMRPDWQAKYLPVDEAHESRPSHAYSVSKLVLEEMGRSFTRGTRMHVICFRSVAVVTDGMLGDYSELLRRVGPRWLFYYVVAQDVARAVRLALECDGPEYGVFFLTAADTSRAEPTLEWYQERVGTLPELANPAVYEENPRASIFSSARARAEFGWEPTSDFLALEARTQAE